MTDDTPSDDLSDIFGQYKEAHRTALQLKDDGRKSPDSFDAYRLAAEKFIETADLSREILLSPKIDSSERIQLEVFCPYYFYEAERSLSCWHYERRETELAHSHLSKSCEHLDEYIGALESSLHISDASLAARFTACLKTARFFKQSDILVFGSIAARAAWNRGNFISALDEYRRLAPNCKLLLEETKAIDDPSYYRIALGNYLSMFANASAALAMHISKSQELPGVLPHDIACSLLRNTLDAYRAGMAGFDANPEWSQYRDLALRCRQHVEELLRDNKSRWVDLYAELHDDADFVKIMARLDLPTLKSLERGGPVANVGHSALAREDLIKRITLALCTLQAYVESINRLRLFDINSVSEDFFALFLSEFFNLSLVNLNVGTKTQAAIDLGDKAAKESVQVTSDGSKTKVRKTLETFQKHNLHKEYDRLRVIVIGKRVGQYAGVESAMHPVFDPDVHVLGIPELVQSLAGLETRQLRRLVEIIDHEMPAAK